ncbi:MAG: hypothetical protein JNK29_14330 [Anaerolineales bacterium]|nr:hypothetical protein [Anaerolineales bacterium]
MESELKAYHRLYAERFVIRERRPAAQRRPAAAHTAAGPAELWFDEAALKIHQTEVARTLGCSEGVLVVVHDSLPPAYPGLAGPIPAGQPAPPCAVLLIFVCPAGTALLDRRLYLPEAWFAAERPASDVAASVPAWVSYQTGPALGAEMVRAAVAAGRLPIRWVLLDQAYSRDWRLLDDLHLAGQTFWVEAGRAQAVWHRASPSAGAWEAERADILAARLPGPDWQALGCDEATAQRLVLDRRGRPGPEGWLIVQRPAGRLAVDQWQFAISNAARSLSAETLAQIASWRAAALAAVGECRLEAAEAAPGWAGWHHQMTLTMVAHHFRLQLRRRFGPAAPALNMAQSRRLLEAVLLRPDFDVQPAVAEIEQIQRQNLADYRPTGFSIPHPEPVTPLDGLYGPCPAI